jgi:hypothetical protein
MLVLSGGIHLHTHSPSVLTSPSGSRQQAGSGSLRARSWCWTLSGRKHFPANSFTWKELLASLTTYLFNHNHLPHLERGYTQAKHEFTLASKPRAVQHCVATTSNWETDTGFPNRLINHEIDSRFRFRDFTRCTEISTHRLDGSEQNVWLSQNDTGLFPVRRMKQFSGTNTNFFPKSTQASGSRGVRFRRSTRVSLQRFDPFTLRQSGRIEEEPTQQLTGMGVEPPTQLASAILTACTWVDTCHP